MNLLVDVAFNKEVAEDGALYWSRNKGDLAKLIDKVDAMDEEEIKKLGQKAKERVNREYNWGKISRMYEKIFV